MDEQNRGVPPVPPWVQDEQAGIPDARIMQDRSEVVIEPPKIEPPPGAEPYYPEVDEEERFQYALSQAFDDPDPEEMRARLFGSRALSELTGLSLRDAFDGSYSLSGIFTGEKTMKGFWKRVKNDVDYNWKLQSQIVPLYLQLLNGDESPELLEQIAKAESSVGMPPSMEGRGILEKMIGGAASQMPMYLKSTAQGAKVGMGVAALAALTAIIAGQLGPQVALPEEAITAPGFGLLGFRMGFRVGSAHYMTEMMAALTYRDLMQMRDKNGQPVNPKTARAVAWGVGIIQGLIEQSQFQMFTKSMGIAQKASNAMVGRSVFKTLTNSRLINLVFETAKFVGAETAEEILQEITAIGGEELMKELENYKGADFDHATAGAALQRLLSTAIQSGIAIMGMGLPGAAMKFGPSVVKDIRTLSESKKFAELTTETQKAVPVAAAPKEQAPRMTAQEFKQKIDVAFPSVTAPRKDAYFKVLERLANKQGQTLDEWVGLHTADLKYGGTMEPASLFQADIVPVVEKKGQFTAEYSPAFGEIRVNPVELEKLHAMKRYDHPADQVVLEHERFHAFWDKIVPDEKKLSLLNGLDAIPQAKGVDVIGRGLEERAVETLTVYVFARDRLSTDEKKWASDLLAEHPDIVSAEPAIPIDLAEETLFQGMRVSVRKTVNRSDRYGDRPGYGIYGRDSFGRSVHVFTEDKDQADRIAQAYREGRGEDVGRILLERTLQQGPVIMPEEKRGAVTFLEDGRAILRGFESGDISTLIHETAHIFRRDLEGQVLKDAEEFCSVVNGVWTRENEETFADAFEEYMATQEAPTPGLKAVFEAFKQWLYEIYQGLRSTLTPKMKAVFDSMFSDELQKDDKDDVTPEEFPATRQEIASQIKNTKQRIRYLTGQVKVSELVKETDVMREAYKKAAKSYKEGLKEGKAIERKKQQEKRYVKQMRAYAKKLAMYLIKPVSKAVDFYYAEAVEAMGAGIDPKFRSNKKLAEIEERKAFLEKHSERVEDMPRKLLEDMNKKSLDDVTVDDLEHMVAERRHLEQVGRLKLRLKEAQRKRSFAEHLNENINAINDGKPQTITEGNKKEFIAKRAWKGWQAWNLRIMRIADWLDGGMAFRGPNHDYLYNRVNRFVSAAMKKQDERQAVVMNKTKELGVTHRLGKTERIGDWKFTHDQIIDIYMGMQNKKKAAAIVYGNIIRHSNTMEAEEALDLLGQFVDRLSPQEREFGDFLIDEYEQNYARLRAAYIAFTNLDLGKEERYSPIHRINADYGEDLPQQLAKELLEHSDFHKAFAAKGFTIDRKEIPDEYQLEISLGALSTWLSQSDKQEHFIHGATTIRDLQRMVNDDAYQTAVRERLGPEFVKSLKEYANRVANPNIYKTYTAAENISRIMRSNMAISALAYNVSTMVKQLPAVFFFLADAGPLNFLGATMKFAVNPVKAVRFANTEPQIKSRSLDRFTEELKQQHRGVYEKIVAGVGQAGMRPIYWFDKMMVSIGYQAVYDKVMHQYGDETFARQEALNSVLRTQGAGHAKDVARLYASSEWLNWFLMFTNQLNQMYNMISYDIPNSRKKVGGGVANAFWTLAGLSLSAITIWAIQHKRLPEDDDDLKEAMSEGFWGTIPIVGKIYLDVKNGWGGATEMPALKTVEGLIGVIATLMNKDEPSAVQMRKFFEAIGTLSGFPVVGSKRIVKFFETGKPIELIGGKSREKK